jgi:spore germination protein
MLTTLLLLAGAVFWPAPRAAAQVPRKLVVGYYVPYDPTSWASLSAHADRLNVVAAQWVTIDACGNLSSQDDQTLKQFARERGVLVVPSLLTNSRALNHQLLTDEQTAANAIDQIVAYTLAEEYDGFDLDLENIDPDDRPYLSQFVGQLATALHAVEKPLLLAVPPKERDVTTGWAGAFDYAALGAAADLVTIMAYEYRGPFSGPGSVAPYDWVSRVVTFSTGQIEPSKVLLGLSFYGYDWNMTSGGARSLSFAQFARLAAFYGSAVSFDASQQSASFTYETVPGQTAPGSPALPRLDHQVTRRSAPACDVALPTATPAPPRPAPDDRVPQSHEVWIEDSASAAARLRLADRDRTAGVATWRLGLEDPAVWDVFATWRGS